MTKNIRALISKLLIIPVLSIGTAGIIGLSVSADCSGDIKSDPLNTGTNCAKNESQPTNITGEDGVLKIVTNTLLFIIGAVSVIMIIYGGIMYTTSGGDSSRVQAAKNTILYAVIGLIVAILAFAIVNFVIGNFTSK